MQFAYKGRNSIGEIVSGFISAKDFRDAVQHVRESGVTPFSVKEKKRFHIGSLKQISVFNSVKLGEKIIFTKNLAGMLRAGLPLSRALEVLDKQTTNVYFKKILVSLLETIDKGGTFSDGLAKHPKVFSALFVSMVRAGEESGGMPAALLEIGVNLEKTYALNRKIKSALMYPTIIVCAIVLIGILMFIYVVPTLTKTFKELGVELPLSTRIVVGISDLVNDHLILLVLGILVLVVGAIFAFRMPRSKRMIDYVSTRLPVIGTLLKEVNAARTTRTLSSLLSSGVDISRAIGITKEVLQNSYYRAVLAEVEIVIQKGEPMSSIFRAHKELYPIMVGEMMEVGEETGKLSSMLLDIAAFYEGEVEAKTKDLSTIIEPILMIFIGAAVGFFAISMLSPMYSIMDAVK